MQFELPVCKRCCFCVPLRYGLLVWGYLKLAFSVLVILGLSFILSSMIYHIKTYGGGSRIDITNIILFGIASLIAVADLVLGFVFIVGCHKKNVALLKIYYFYSIFLLVLLIAISFYAVGSTIYYMRIYIETVGMIMYVMVDFMTFFANVALQGYITLLVRSEIVKLDQGCQFRFVNNAAEAQCTLNVEDQPNKNNENTRDKHEVLYNEYD